MRWISFFVRCAVIAPVVVAPVQANVVPRQSIDMPVCMKQCKSVAFQASTCFKQSGQWKLRCECRATLFEPAMQNCLAKVCKPKDIFSTLDAVSISCNEPVRNKSKSYRTVLIVFFTLGVTSVVARYATYFTVGRTNWLDHANMAVIFVLNIVLFACCIRMSYLGLGRDIWKLEAHKIESTLLYFWDSAFVYIAVIGLVKTSFLIFYLQIFPDKCFRIVVWSCIILNLTATFACTMAAIFVCSPISFAWTQWDGEHMGHCVSNNNLAFAHAGIGIAMDFMALALPVTRIWNLHLSTKKKIGVLLMFSVGAFVTVVSMLRLRSLVHFANTQNMTWDYLEASRWSVIEVEVGITCACMPSIRLGLVRLFPKILGSTLQSDAKQTCGTDSHGNTLGTCWSTHGIGVTTSVRVSRTMRSQTYDEDSFVQLVEIDADTKSSRSNETNWGDGL